MICLFRIVFCLSPPGQGTEIDKFEGCLQSGVRPNAGNLADGFTFFIQLSMIFLKKHYYCNEISRYIK